MPKKPTTEAQNAADAESNESTQPTSEVSIDAESATGQPLDVQDDVSIGQPKFWTTQEGGLIHAAMANVNASIGYIAKGGYNQVQKFSFRGVDDVYRELHKILAENGIFTRPEVLEARTETRTTRKGDPTNYVIAKMRYHFTAPDGSSVPADAIGEALDSGDKAANKAMANAHKYALTQTFTIPTGDPESDSEANDGTPVGRGRPPRYDGATGEDTLTRGRPPANDHGQETIPARSRRTRVERSKPTQPQDDAWTTPTPDAAKEARDNASGPQAPSEAPMGTLDADDLMEKLADLSMDDAGLQECRKYHTNVTQAVKANLISPTDAKEMLDVIKVRANQIKEQIESDGDN